MLNSDKVSVGDKRRVAEHDEQLKEIDREKSSDQAGEVTEVTFEP